MTKIITQFACLNRRSFVHLFAFVFLISATQVFSQNDIAVQLLEPVNGQEINPNDSFTLKLAILNLGPTDVAPFDPIGVDANVGGNFVYSTVFAVGIPVGQTYIFETKIVYNFTGDHPNQAFCSSATILFPPDTNFFNNIACTTVNLAQGTTGSGFIINNDLSANITPNPSQGNINIDFNKVINENLRLNIFDNNGTCKYSIKNINSSIDLDLSDLAKGLYYAVISGSNTYITKKLILQ